MVTLNTHKIGEIGNYLSEQVHNCGINKSDIIVYVNKSDLINDTDRNSALHIKSLYEGLNSTQVEVPVVCYEFYVNSNKNSGVQKYAFIQTDSANNLLPKAHLVKYVEPLFLLGGTFPCLGALIYTLTSVQ